MPKTVVYIHICCLNNYKEVVSLFFQWIKESGLYAEIDEIRCCILGDYDPEIFRDEKVKIRAVSSNLSLYEVFTVNTLYEDCKREEMNVLYLHSKGVTKPTNANVKSWVQYMCYFLVFQHARCLELLETHDSVGVNLHADPVLHYSGNFWWATSAYISKLDPCQYTCFNSPEFWLTEKRIGDYHCMWESNINHYYVTYPAEEYASPL